MKIGRTYPDGSFGVVLDWLEIKCIIETALKQHVLEHTKAKRITGWSNLAAWSMPREGRPNRIRFFCISKEVE